MIFTPPRYGVGTTWTLCPRGWSRRSVLMATRIANGARAQTVIRETRAAPTSRPSTDKPQALLDGLFAGLDVSDHVVDRLVDRAGRPQAREVLEGRRIGLAPAELLEALVIGLLVADERDLRVRAG